MKVAAHHRSAARQRTRRAFLEALEPRCLLSATDVSLVPFWDGDTAGPPDCLLNRFGGNPVAGIQATVSCEALVVQSGTGALRVDTNQPIAPGNFDFIGTALTGFGPTSAYVDTRDITNFSEVGFWLKNTTGAGFRLVFEIKDYRDSNDHRARFTGTVAAGSAWTPMTIPLHLGAGWTVIGNPDLSRTKLFALVIEAQTAPVNGSLYLDSMTLREKGGVLNPQTATVDQLAGRIAQRQFLGLWGSRDHATGLVPAISAYADVMALNSTAGLVQVLPAAVQSGWITQGQADAYLIQLAATLQTAWDHVQATGNGGYIPPRYMDRVSLAPCYVREESPVDAAFLFLALYQYRSLGTTDAATQAAVDGLLQRFNFAAFSSPAGWKLAYVYDSGSLTAGTYDGYSTEIYVISLAAHLAPANRLDITTHWNSGVNRTLDHLMDSAEQHLVHSDTRFRAPFLQWLFHVFADVSDRGDDSYPDAALRRNPYWNAVLYQREADRKLAALGRSTCLQPDAGDDGTGAKYEQFSMYNQFGEPDLCMPWSVTFALIGDTPQATAAFRDLLARDFHGPLGLSDSVTIATGAAVPTRLTARHDFWNVALSTMALVADMAGVNREFAQLPAVDSALDQVFPVTVPALPVPAALATDREWLAFTPTNYNPNTGQFPTAASLRADLERLYWQGWRGIVTYTLDGTLSEVPRLAKEVGFTKVIAGIYWYDAAQLAREKAAVAAADPYVDAYVLGNEGLWAGRYTRTALEQEIARLKQLTGKPVATTEVGYMYLADPTLMDIGDWVFPNIQPYCGGVFDPAQAATQVRNEFLAIQAQARARIPGRITAVKEAWWPADDGDHDSETAQAEFFRLLAATETLFVWGESFDQPWKPVSECSGGGPIWGLNTTAWYKAVIPQDQTIFTDRYPHTVDYGDAPEPAYPTLLANHGAGHLIVPGFQLGTLIDAEPDGQPNAAATGDDLAANADEDGVAFLKPLVPGQRIEIRVTASAAGVLNAWLDMNDDGDWDDNGEHFVTDALVSAGQNVLTRSIPATARTTLSTFARFRFSSVGGLSYTGLAPDGEVEDYEVAIETPVKDDLVGRAPSGDWWVAKSTGTSLVNQQWGHWDPIAWHDVHVADFSGDGRADIVGRTDWGEWWVAKANGAGTGFVNERWGFWSPVTWLDVHVADVNGDDRADIVGRTEWGDWWVAKANSTGTGFVNERWGFWSPITWLDVHVADVNGDGRADIVGRTVGGDWWVAKANGTGTGFVNERWGFWSPVTWLDVQVADVNGDGRADIVGRTAGGQWWVAKANGTGTGFVNQLWGFWSPIAWQDVQVADVTGDGRADIVGRANSGEWWVAKANDTGTGFVNLRWGVWSPITWHDVQVADVSGDGRADIVGRTDWGDWWVAKANETGTGSVNQRWGYWSPVAWSDVHAADVTGPEAAPALTALTAAPSPTAAESLGQEQLHLAVEQAIQQGEAAGLAAAQLAAFRDVHAVIADLPGLQLGMATSKAIVLDVNAAGYGWYTGKDEGRRTKDESASVSPLGMDPLTAVLHELGHAAGLSDEYGDPDNGDVMSAWLLPGTRRLPTLADVDAFFENDDWWAR